MPLSFSTGVHIQSLFKGRFHTGSPKYQLSHSVDEQPDYRRIVLQPLH